MVPLCIHSIAYNFVPIFFMIPLGFSIGISVRMGHVLSHDVHRAQLIASSCVAFVTFLGALVGSLMYFLQKPMVALFSSDEEVAKVRLQVIDSQNSIVGFSFSHLNLRHEGVRGDLAQGLLFHCYSLSLWHQ